MSAFKIFNKINNTVFKTIYSLIDLFTFSILKNNNYSYKH